MAQLFKESANVVAKLSLMLGAGLPLIVFYIGSTVSRSPANTNAGVGLNQPIPFSHKHHVFELGIDCRYCHVSVEKSAVASVPTSETCMSCHSQIWTNSPLLQPVRDSYKQNEPLEWTKVNKVPEFVYFNHSIHIDRGVSCNECHGAVQQQQMTAKAQAFSMSWCLECHSQPENYLYQPEKSAARSPREQIFELYRKYQSGTELSGKEYSLIKGMPYSPSAEEAAKGKDLVEKYKVKFEQLKDCYICHK